MFFKLWPFKSKKIKVREGRSEGAAAVEFALIAPVFFLVFLGIFEVGAVLLVQTSLQTAILQVSRFGRTGSMVTGQTPQQTAESLATTYSFGLVDPSKVVLTVTPYSSFAAIPTNGNAPNNGSQDFGKGNQPMLYTLSYKWTPFTPLVGNLLAPGGSINIMVSTVIQNEPY